MAKTVDKAAEEAGLSQRSAATATQVAVLRGEGKVNAHFLQSTNSHKTDGSFSHSNWKLHDID